MVFFVLGAESVSKPILNSILPSYLHLSRSEPKQVFAGER